MNETDGKTTLTSQQMRELAYEGDERALETLTRSPGAVYTLTAALRTAADQLEAVQANVKALVNEYQGDTETAHFDALLGELCILTTDTAPQEDWDDPREGQDWDWRNPR